LVGPWGRNVSFGSGLFTRIAMYFTSFLVRRLFGSPLFNALIRLAGWLKNGGVDIGNHQVKAVI
jgi:hypothetical protein